MVLGQRKKLWHLSWDVGFKLRWKDQRHAHKTAASRLCRKEHLKSACLKALNITCNSPFITTRRPAYSSHSTVLHRQKQRVKPSLWKVPGGARRHAKTEVLAGRKKPLSHGLQSLELKASQGTPLQKQQTKCQTLFLDLWRRCQAESCRLYDG